MDDGRPWYERQPKRLEWELKQFGRLGLPVTRAEASEQGPYIICTEMLYASEIVPIEVHLPVEYPDFPPLFFGPLGLLPRHQDPNGGNLCVFEDSDLDWRTWRSAAEIASTNLKRLLEDSPDPDTVRREEADLPEPVSAQMKYAALPVMVVPEPFMENDLGATAGAMWFLVDHDEALAVVTELEGVGAADAGLVRSVAVSTASRRRASWVDVGHLGPQDVTDDGIQALMARALQKQNNPRLLQVGGKRSAGKRRQQLASQWVGLTFLEEGPQRGETRRNWAFAYVTLDRGGQPRLEKVSRCQALTREERLRRTPTLRGLTGNRLLVVGAGSLGAPVALELAKAGADVDIIDEDRYDVNNAVRHVLPVQFAGRLKALDVAAMCRAMNPFAHVVGHPVSIGDVDGARLLTELLEKCAAVIDTTGSVSVERALERYCRSAQLPLLAVGLTAGNLGADLVVMEPNGACRECFKRQQDEGVIPAPPQGPRSNVTPAGCGHPAAFGAGFDATEVAAMTARMVLRRLGSTSLPPLTSTWMVLDLYGDSFLQQGTFDIDPDCSGDHDSHALD